MGLRAKIAEVASNGDLRPLAKGSTDYPVESSGLAYLAEHRDLIAAQIRRKVPNSADAADLLQDVSVAILLASANFADKRHFLSWCAGVVDRMVRKWQRSHVRRVRLETQAGATCVSAAWSTVQTPELATANVELLSQALAGVDERDLHLLVARYVHCSTAAEIARGGSWTPTAVRMRLSRLRASVRRDLAM